VKSRMTKYAKFGLILAVLVAVVLLATVWATTVKPITPLPWEPRHFPYDRIQGDLELFYTAKTIISSVNITLLVILLIAYLNIYRKTQSEFTLGLIIFSTALLLYAIASNPIVQLAFGFYAFGLGPFAMLPDLFTCIASAMLLYLTIKY